METFSNSTKMTLICPSSDGVMAPLLVADYPSCRPSGKDPGESLLSVSSKDRRWLSNWSVWGFRRCAVT